MITFSNTFEALNNLKLSIFSNLAPFEKIYNQKNNEKLLSVFSSAIWDNVDIKDIRDKSSNNLVSSIWQGKDVGKTGIPSFRKNTYQFIINNPQCIKDTIDILDTFLKELDLHKDLFITKFTDILQERFDDTYPNDLYAYLGSMLQTNPPEFLTWLFFTCLLQKDIIQLQKLYEIKNNHIIDDDIYSFLEEKQIQTYGLPTSSFVADIPENLFWDLRRLIVSNTGEKLIMSGQSLMEALDNENNKNIINELQFLIRNGVLKQIYILLTDPSIFSIKQNCTRPLQDIDRSVTTIIEILLKDCQKYGCHIDLYFIPLLEIDHTVITNDYLLLRSTKLWTVDRKYKGAYCLFQNVQTSGQLQSEYTAQKEYIQVLMRTCTNINPSTDIYEKTDTPALELHNKWRKKIASLRYTCISLHKLYNSQLTNFVVNGWTSELDIHHSFIPSSSITCYEDLYNPENLLNDNSQRTLLPFIRKTQELLNAVVKDYDSSRHSGAIIYPSLDLGYPNNVQRLSGGFATGLFVQWQCGTNIIPVDATVNVCSSSVFKLDHFSPEQLDSDFTSYLDNKIFLNASNKKGYSFSFDSGNHFLMIAQDNTGDYYLVLHSSANEFKNSYMGLYPIEVNWYSDKIKTKTIGDRYIRYIKDEEARYFTKNAQHLCTYNEQIHSWLATQVNNKSKPAERDSIIKHHYYMPTDSSIAIGTFVEAPGQIVPMFSNVGKPIYLFRIGNDNWKISIDGEEKCLVPHGWGQQIEVISGIGVDHDRQLLFLDKHPIPISSEERIHLPDKKVRDFSDGKEFLRIGEKMVKGKIEKTLYPRYLYCNSIKGKLPNVR